MSDDAYEEFARGHNPFLADRVARAGPPPADVPDVHRAQFDALARLAAQARADNAAVGAVVWGESGSGKSHLLRRLEAWAADGRAVFVAPLALRVPADELPRSVLRDVLAAVAAHGPGGWHESVLYAGFVALAEAALPGRKGRFADVEAYYRAAVLPLVPGGAAPWERDPLYDALFRFWRVVYYHRVGRGDGSDAGDVLRALAVEAMPADAAHRALAALAQVARLAGRPLVLAFDEVSTFEPAQVAALARFLHALHNNARNTLIVLSEVRDKLERYVADQTIMPATWDRLAQREIDLGRLTVPQARQLLEARLAEANRPFAGLPADPLYPLGSAWFEGRAREFVDLKPRKVLQLARRRWDELFGGDAGPSPPPAGADVDAVVAAAVAARLEATRGRLPPDAANAAGLTAALLRLADPPPAVTRPAPPYDLTAGGAGVKFLMTTNPGTVTFQLGVVLGDPSPPARTVLVTDERTGLPCAKGPAPPGRVRYDTLRARGDAFRHVELTAGDAAALDALDHVARHAADLDLTTADVAASYRRTGRLRDHPLLGVLLAGREPTPESPPPADGGLSIGRTAAGEPVTVPAAAMPTHLAVVGAAGSGKTWLAKVLAEEAVLAGVAVLAIDPQGDLVQFLRDTTADDLSADDRARAAEFRRRAAVRVLTPGTDHAERVTLSPLKLPAATADAADADDLLETTAAHLVGLAGAGGEPAALLAATRRVLRALADRGDDAVSFGAVADVLFDPASAGLDDADRLVRKADRERLARRLNALADDRLFAGGPPLDLGRLVAPPGPGRVALNVVYLNALSCDQPKQAFVAALAVEVYRWMATTGHAGGRPRLLFYLDEARDYLPAGAAKPAAKPPLLRLFAQGRKYGVACLVCTQSPRSVDYQVFGNCSTKLVGRLEAAQDVERVEEWFAAVGPRPAWVRGRLGAGPGQFVGRWPGQPAELDGAVFTSRPLYSRHEGAWSPERVREEVRSAGG